MGGDGPWRRCTSGHGFPASPRGRGWTLEKVHVWTWISGFPAWAGMDPATSPRSCTTSRLPRVGGDGPPSSSDSRREDAASPRGRGWTPQHPHDHVQRVGFPSWAGMDPLPRPTPGAKTRLPRVGGDGPVRSPTRASPSVASPRGRGWTPEEAADPGRGPGFPRVGGDGPQAFRRLKSPYRLPRVGGGTFSGCRKSLLGGRAEKHRQASARLAALPDPRRR